MLLPASDLAEILTNLSALKLQPNTAAQILAAVLAPLTRADRSSEATDPSPKRAARSRRRPRAAPRRRKYKRRAARPTEARERAIAVLQANPDVTLARIAKLAKCGYGTVVNARKELAAEARRKPRETMPSTPIGGAKTDRRQRAQQFLKDELARGPKKVTDVEEAAAKAHVDPQTLDLARADLGIVTSRANTGGVQAVQWSLPG
jgi:hypothetical protein